MIKAVVFDLDGTLLDTLGDIGGSMNTALAEMGLPAHPVDNYRYYAGDGVEKLAERALPVALRDPVSVARGVALMRAEYAKRWDRSLPYAGIPEMLDALCADGIRLMVLSNKPDDFTQVVVGKLLGKWRFDPAAGARAGVPKKPHPQGALDILKSTGLRGEEVAFLGDTEMDIFTARGAGMHAIGVLWGFRPREEMANAGAHHIIAHPSELLPLLKTL